jgi:hypothetical protein
MRLSALSILVLSLLVGCTQQTSAPTAVVSVELATCEHPIGGPFALPADTAVEAEPGYEAYLASLDFQSLPEQLDLSETGIYHQMLIAFMLEVPRKTLGTHLNRDQLLNSGYLGTAVVAAFAESARLDAPQPDLTMLRRGLHRWYACERGLPMSLTGFQATVHDFTSLPTRTLFSSAKNEERRLREDPSQGIYVSETLVDGAVRETEIILEGWRSDGALEFVVYDEDGHLADRSQFITEDGVDISGAAPYVCIACHLNPGTFEVNTPYPLHF